MVGRRRALPRRILAPDVPDDLQVVEFDDPDDEVSWSGCEVSGTFTGSPDACLDATNSVFRSMVFTGTQFESFGVADVIFEGCEFTAAGLIEASLSRAEFRSCRLRAVDFGAAHLRDVRFVDCQLDEASLRLCRGEHVGFEGSTMRGVDLYGARITHAHLTGCDLTGAELSQSDLTEARLVGSTLDGIRGVSALRGVTIDAGQAVPLGLLLLGAAGIRIEDEADLSDRV